MEKIKMQGTQIPSALWFDKWYDSAVRAVPGTIEVLQRPGETVYVPAGWPHLVLNLERTVAITHNYATEYPSMDRIVRAVEEEEPELAMKWMQLLRRLRPELVTLNTKQQDRTEAQFVAVDSLEVSDARIR
jgi:oxalate decarboxylase/phosphoglucose isomerase-like protein (cupin superfamily)